MAPEAPFPPKLSFSQLKIRFGMLHMGSGVVKAEGALEDSSTGRIGGTSRWRSDHTKGLRCLQIYRRSDKVEGVQQIVAFGAEGNKSHFSEYAESLY